MIPLLELNDAELGLYLDGRTLYRQPAVALLGEDGNRFGLPALRAARRHPRQANQQYLARLNADPLPVPGKQAFNHADLVYLHLLELKAALPAQAGDAQMAAAAPGCLTGDQLGVLLGIAQEAGIVLRGFADSAVLMASAAALPPRAWLLDLHLNRACLTELLAGEEVCRGQVEELPGCGLMSCIDGWAGLLADRFVQDTRFDPLHAADTEQQLYDHLYDWAAQAGGDADEAFAVEIQHQGHGRRVELAASALRGKLMQRLQLLSGKLPADAQLLATPRAARLPGLLDALAELGWQAATLPPDALQQGFRRHAERIAEGEIRLLTQLPCESRPAPPAPAAAPLATHALFESRAWPLRGNPFGLPATGRAGERVARDGRTFELIAVQPGADARADGSEAPGRGHAD